MGTMQTLDSSPTVLEVTEASLQYDQHASGDHAVESDASGFVRRLELQPMPQARSRPIAFAATRMWRMGLNPCFLRQPWSQHKSTNGISHQRMARLALSR